MIVAITGTGMPFPRLVDALAEYARAHPAEPVWVQAGATALPVGLPGAAIVAREVLLARLAASDAVVCHGGCGAVQDALASGLVPVVVPRRKHFAEHVNDHQLEIAEALAREGRAVVVHDLADLSAAIERCRRSKAAAPPPRPGESLLGALRRDAEELGKTHTGARSRWRLLRLLTALVPVHRHRALTGDASDR